jgi:uncharacterized glyoxalase superfamily protein PhnB
LGFEVDAISPGWWVRLRRGLVELQIEQSDTIRRLDYGEKGGVAFRVDNVNAWFNELRRRGAEFDQGLLDQQYGHRDFSIIDPNGYKLCFWQPLSELASGF